MRTASRTASRTGRARAASAPGRLHGLGALAIAVALAPGATGPALAAAPRPTPPDPQLLEELALDTARYAEAVSGFRNAANDAIKQTYKVKMRSIKEKYEPIIAINEKEEKQRRLDAIAMFEAFLRKYPDDKRWTPDAMFRLAELYYEKSSEEFLAVQEAYQKALDGPVPPNTPSPTPDYEPTVALYRELLTEFPNYRLLDATYYLLGFCLSEMAREPESKQVMLALTCANKYRPLDPPPPEPAAPPSTAGRTLNDIYSECKPVKEDSKFLPEAWTRVGEMHFDMGELEGAVSAYSRVLAFQDSSYYDKALYKLAWSYYRDNRFQESIREFDRLVKWADERKAAGKEFGSDLRPEAIQYLGISFSEPDWNGDTLPDPETGLQRAKKFYQGRAEEPHVREVFQRLGDIYFDQTKFVEAIEVYKFSLERWPDASDAPQVQDKIVRAFERDRNMVAAAKERELLGRNYSQGTPWYEKNKDDPEALSAARQLSEDALLSAATNVHAAAQACKTESATPTPDQAARCKEMYATAAELYEKYLAAYPDSRRAYEFSAYYADALYYSGQTELAIAAYKAVRDSELDNRYQEDSAFRMIKGYEELAEKMKTGGQMTEPPIPDESNTKPPVQPIPMPEVQQNYVAAIDWYTANLQTDKVDELKYAAAVTMLRYRNWPEARARLSETAKQFCGTQSELGFKAYDAILKTYFIDYSVEDPKQKDCALGRLLAIADEFVESACGKAPAGQPYLARIDTIRRSVKSKVIADRVQLAIENEEKGTDKQLTMCEEGTGGIALVTGGAKAAPGQTTPAGGRGGVSTEIDVGLALDLVDVVNANPKDEDAPTNLNNACVIYERLYQFGEATKCYERLAKDYPDSTMAKDAVWNAARNHRRFFNFDQAVDYYQRIATDPKFEGYEHRKDALGIAAQLLDNDQQYPKAASMYLRFSDAVVEKPSESAQAYSFACQAYKKAKDTGKQTKCLRDLIRRFEKQGEAGDYVVGAYLDLAAIAESGGKKKDILDAYKKVRDEYNSRGLKPATPAAAAAAKADFLLLEDKFNVFKNKQMVFTAKPEQVKATFDSFTEQAKSLRDEYAKVWEYKDATWTLASFLRQGDIFYEFAQKLIYQAEHPPADVIKLEKKVCKLNPDDCGTVEAQYKDGILEFVTPIEDEAKKAWKSTLDRAAQLGVTNQYVKKARENLSRYLPDEFPFVKDERIGLEQP
jgi:tetratricopeptide (TPR) repeat protein